MRIGIIRTIITLLTKFWFDCSVATVIAWGNLTGVGAGLSGFTIELFAKVALFMQCCLQDAVATGANCPATFGGTRITVTAIEWTVIALFAGIQCAIATAWQFA